MEASVAARYINQQVHLMPGFEVRAYDYGGSRMCLQFAVDSYETNDYWYAPKQVTVAPPQTVVDVSDFQDAADLCGVVYDELMHAVAHEHREAIRVGTSMTAPLHPHRPDGERNFRRTRKHTTRKPEHMGSVVTA
jgi:hypothetical protein